MPLPCARSHAIGPNQSRFESDTFSPGISWVLCFFEGADPMIREFQPPKGGAVCDQSVALYIPYHHLYLFAGHVRQGVSTWKPYLTDPSGHCRLRVFKCDGLGVAERWSHTFRAHWDRDYRDGHFKFVTAGAFEGRIKPGLYFSECEFYKGQWERNAPDASYTTGIFEVYNDGRVIHPEGLPKPA